jgi:hypothetical protein
MTTPGFRDLLSLLFGWKPRAAARPVIVNEIVGQVSVAGAAAGEVDNPGAVAGQVS